MYKKSLSNRYFHRRKITIGHICYWVIQNIILFPSTPHTQNFIWIKIVFTSIAIWKRLVIYVLVVTYSRIWYLKVKYYFVTKNLFSFLDVRNAKRYELDLALSERCQAKLVVRYITRSSNKICCNTI